MRTNCLAAIIVLISGTCLCAAANRYPASGLIVQVDAPHSTVVISHQSIPGLMDAMVMPFRFRGPLPVDAKTGAEATFTVVVDKNSSWIEQLCVVEFDSEERDPELAGRLKLLESITGGEKQPVIATGEKVPDFTLTDQLGQNVRLSQFTGKVVAMDFIYTRCPLPDYCFRLSTNFSRLQKRFRERLGKDLVLLTVSFDPLHDTPETLAEYARIWNADSRSWHFLTGAPEEIRRVCALFGAVAWADEGLLTHSLHTVLIGRGGELAANIEGNRFSAGQLGDVVEALLGH